METVHPLIKLLKCLTWSVTWTWCLSKRPTSIRLQARAALRRHRQIIAQELIISARQVVTFQANSLVPSKLLASRAAMSAKVTQWSTSTKTVAVQAVAFSKVWPASSKGQSSKTWTAKTYSSDWKVETVTMPCVKTLSIDSHSKAIREAMSIRGPKVTKETISLHLQEKMKMASARIYKSKTQRVNFPIYPSQITTLVASLFQKHQLLVIKRWTLWATWVAMSWKFQWIPTLTVEWASLSSTEHKKWPTSIKRSNVSRMIRSLASARTK